MLVTCILIITIFIYYKNNDLFNPAIIFNIGWIAALLCFYFYSEKWNIELSLFTEIIIFLGIYSFDFSSFFKIGNKTQSKLERKIKIYDVTFCKIIVIIIYLIVSLIYMYNKLFEISKLSGNTVNNISEILTYVRYGRTHNNITLGSDIAYILRVNYCICLVFSLIFFRKIFFSYRKNKLILLVIFLSFITNVFSGGRLEVFSQILGISIIFIIDYTYIFIWKDKKYLYKIIKWMGLFTSFLFLLFIFHGVFILNRINTNSLENVIDNVAIYLGSSIACFNEYIVGNIEIKSKYLGYHTFITIFGFISHFINIEQGPIFFPPVVRQNFRSNVYTTLFPYISDFTIIGMIIIQFVKGILYKKIYLNCISITKKNRDVLILIYACLINSLVFSFFEEIFFRRLNAIIILILLCLFFYRVLLKVKKEVIVK